MRSRSNLIMNTTIDGRPFGVLYYPTDGPAFSARRQTDLAGVFVSRPVDGASNLIRWNSIGWSASVPADCRLWAFIRNSDTSEGLESEKWIGPLLNANGNDLSAYTARYMQVRIALSGLGWNNEMGISPSVQSFALQGIQSGNAETLYTSVFDLGFIPKHFIVTYNGTIPEDSLLQISVAEDDTLDPERYINIVPNRVQSLKDLPDLAGKLKLMFSIFGDRLVPFEIDRIAFFVSGDGQTKLNAP